MDDDEWMLPLDALADLEELVRERKPGLIVECGSGRSTLALARAQAAHGGRVVALEHDPWFAERTLAMVADLDNATVATCPLGPAGPWQWYTGLPELDPIGMLVVDGPPGWTARLARYPALPLLSHRLEVGATIVLDDVLRRDEAETIARWLAENPALNAQVVCHSKGAAAVLRWRR